MTSAEVTPALGFRKDGALAWIEIANPGRKNALTAAMWESFPVLVARAVDDGDVRVLILRGAGRDAFSAGADISEFESARTGAAARAYDALNEQAFQALSQCPKPTISMIHGFCLGGGLAVALSTDIRLADEASQYAIPAARLGIGYNARWVRPILAAVSPAEAKEMLFTGRRYSAREALSMGLLSRVLHADDLEQSARALAAEIAANAPLSVMAAKRTIDEFVRHPENPEVAELDRLVADCFASADYAEGRRAFLEKRKPEFRGK